MRSLLGWVGAWVIVAIATGIGVWVVVNSIGGREIHTKLNSAQAENDHHSKATPEPKETAQPEETVAVVDTPSPVATPRSKSPHKESLKTEGITVQVLNGTLQKDAGRVMADRLADLGYSIVAVEESVKAYSQTTVFWSSQSSRSAAEALAEHFGWRAQPKPENLSPTVSIHVVVGADEGSG